MVRIQDAGFKVKPRSLWQNGQYYGQNVFVGTSWNEAKSFGDIVDLTIPSFTIFGYTFPAVNLGQTGAKFDFSTSGQLGLQCYAGAFGGDFSGNYDANLVYSYPLFIRPGDTFKVKVTYRTTPSAHFDTTTPQYRAGVDLVANVKAHVGGQAAFFGGSLFNDPNIASPSVAALVPDLNNPTGPLKNPTIISTSDLTDSNLPGLLDKFTPFGMEVSVPVTSTHGIYKNGGLTLAGSTYSPFVSFNTSLLGLITAAAGKAGEVADFTNADYSYTSDALKLSAAWKLAAFEAENTYGFKQTVTLSDAPEVTLTGMGNVSGANNGGAWTFTKDNESHDFTFTMPADKTPLTIGTAVRHVPKLTNRIDTGVGGSISFTPFAIDLSAQVGIGPYAQSFSFKGAVDEKKLDFGTAGIQNVADETTPLGADALSVQAVRNLALNSFDDSKPSPDALWAGDPNVTVDGQVPYAQPPAYNFYSLGSGGIDQFPAYNLTLVPQQGYAFNGIDASDQANMQAYVTAWDGQSRGNLPDGVRQALTVVGKTPANINLHIPASLLRPGRHSLDLTVVASFKGVQKIMNYTVPVVVRVPVPVTRSQNWNSIQFEDNPNSHFTNRFYRTTQGGTFFLKVGQALLETEVVLDDSIVLPSTKYVQLGAGGDAPTTVTTDASLNYSDADELQYYTSGNSIVSFTLSTELIKRLSGSVHSVRLRTKDVKGTRLDVDPSTVGDTYTLSTEPGSSQDVRDTKIYFWVNKPTIASATYKEGSAIPETGDPVRIEVTGTEFTPTASATLKVAGVPYVLPVEFKSDTKLFADVTPDVLLALQKSGHQGTLTVSTPSMTIPNPTLDTPILGGGSATASVTFAPLAPSVDSMTPGSPLRGQATTLTVNGKGFANSGVTAGSSEVSIDGTILPASSVHFASVGRELTSLQVDVPASLLTRADKKRLRVVNHSTNGYDLIGSLDFTVSNAKPALTNAALTVVADDVNAPMVALTGGLFYNDTSVLVDSANAGVKLTDPTHLTATLPASKTDQPSARLSVLNPAPGGGQSTEVPVTILEGNASRMSFTGGLTSFDVKTNSFRQQVTMRYDGNRTLRGKIAVDFSDLPSGVSVVGTPQITVGDMFKGNTVTFTVNFRRTGTAPITFTAKGRFL